MTNTDYRFTVRPLTPDEGGGYLIEYPDLPGCISDGETIEEAIANGEDAKRCWIAAMRQAGRAIPPPSVEATEAYSGKWQLRAPKSLHRRLAERAKSEGVSLNALAVILLAEGVGKRSSGFMITEELRKTLVGWAKSKPTIKALYVFGSYARGNATKDSDLDLAFELCNVPDEDEAELISKAHVWKTEIQELTGIPVKDVYPISSPKVKCPVLVYRRATERVLLQPHSSARTLT